jgi:hypothetical protein
MKIEGERVRRTKLIQTDRFVVAVEVEMVVPVDDPDEPCYEPETLSMLKEIRDRAVDGDVAWLKERGKVYEALQAVPL